MSVRVTIAGSDRDTLRSSAVTLERRLNTRSTMRCRLLLPLPARLAEITLYAKDQTTPLFGGLILRRFVQGLEYGSDLPVVELECADYLAYADFRYVTLAYTSQVAVETVVDAIVDNYLAIYGITYTPAATGVLLEPFEWTSMRASDALRDVSERSGLVLKISPSKVLTITAPGATSTPFSVTLTSPKHRELSWSDVAEIPVNKVILYGGAGQRATTETFTTDGLAHGGITNYITKYPAAQDYHGMWPNILYFNGVLQGPIGWEPITPLTVNGGVFEWVWDPVNHRLRHDDTTYGLTAAGIDIDVGYMIQYPYIVERSSGATPVVEQLFAAPEVMIFEQGEQLADAKLAQGNQLASELTMLTLEDGVEPGQELPVINLTTRELNDDFIVTAVSLNISAEQVWEYAVTAIDSALYLGSFIDEWRAMLGGSSTPLQIGTGGSTGGSGLTTALLAPVYLGGSRNTTRSVNPAAWTPAVDYVSFTPTTSFSGMVRVDLWARNASIGVTARLYNVTDAAAAGTSSKVTSQTSTAVTFLVTVEAGKTYRLELLSDTNGEGVYGLGTIESL